MVTSKSVPSNWRARYVRLSEAINYWQLVECLMVYYGIQRGFGGLVGEVGHLDADRTRRSLLGMMIETEAKLARRKWNEVGMDREDLEARCVGNGILESEFKNLKMPNRNWAQAFKRDLIAGTIFNPLLHVNPKLKKRLENYLQRFEAKFRQMDRQRVSIPEMRRRLAEGIPHSSQREANLLWDSIQRTKKQASRLSRRRLKRK